MDNKKSTLCNVRELKKVLKLMDAVTTKKKYSPDYFKKCVASIQNEKLNIRLYSYQLGFIYNPSEEGNGLSICLDIPSFLAFLKKLKVTLVDISIIVKNDLKYLKIVDHFNTDLVFNIPESQLETGYPAKIQLDFTKESNLPIFLFKNAIAKLSKVIDKNYHKFDFIELVKKDNVIMFITTNGHIFAKYSFSLAEEHNLKEDFSIMINYNFMLLIKKFIYLLDSQDVHLHNFKIIINDDLIALNIGKYTLFSSVEEAINRIDYSFLNKVESSNAEDISKKVKSNTELFTSLQNISMYLKNSASLIDINCKQDVLQLSVDNKKIGTITQKVKVFPSEIEFKVTSPFKQFVAFLESIKANKVQLSIDKSNKALYYKQVRDNYQFLTILIVGIKNKE